MKKQIAVLGGDGRQIHLARLLSADGWNVVTWGLDREEKSNSIPLHKALESEMVVLPLPVCRGQQLNLPLSDTVLDIEELFGQLCNDQIILGGMIRSIPQRVRDECSLALWDYYDREEVQIANAVPTAEGAIMRAIGETEVTLLGSKCLVVGFGRIGKILSHRLKALGAEVTVSARKTSDLAMIEACGCRSVHTEHLDDCLHAADLIFNTVPAMVLAADRIRIVNRQCVLIELASNPGGFDLKAVKENNLKYLEERGLPGKIAPLSSARSIQESIYRILKERGISL